MAQHNFINFHDLFINPLYPVSHKFVMHERSMMINLKVL